MLLTLMVDETCLVHPRHGSRVVPPNEVGVLLRNPDAESLVFVVAETTDNPDAPWVLQGTHADLTTTRMLMELIIHPMQLLSKLNSQEHSGR